MGLIPVSDPSQGSTYHTVPADKIDFIEIFPPVGIARLGDSKLEYFFAPEVPGVTKPPTPDGNFRDSQQKIRRQAVRFRVYAYDSNGKILGELNSKNGYQLAWTVHVANKKPAFTQFRGIFDEFTGDLRNPDVDPIGRAEIKQDPSKLDTRSKLIIDPKEQNILQKVGSQTVELIGQFQGSKQKPKDVYLGELHVDDAGRLVFLGGLGYSHCVNDPVKPQPEVISEFDSIDWVDDVCDGWVSVKVLSPNLTVSKVARHKATVLSAPPKFVWGIDAPTSLYDVMENIYPNNKNVVEFYTHIWPVLLNICSLSWVNDHASEGHGYLAKGNFISQKFADFISTSTNSIKDIIFGRLRQPDYENSDQAGPTYMPRLSGDGGDLVEPGVISEVPKPIRSAAALTKLQYGRFENWKNGHFKVTKAVPENPSKIEDITLSEQPRYLTRASLEPTIGDPLFPGIETWWIGKLPGTYDLTVEKLDPPFRVNHNLILPGHLTGGLSLPWQADFDECNTHWWPSVRPDDIVTEADFKSIMKGSGTHDENFAKATITRKNWTRGLRDTPTDYISFPGSTDMVRYWKYLGFVKKHPTEDAYLESEHRQLPDPPV